MPSMPRWFLVGLLVVLAGSAYALALGQRYKPMGGLWVLDSWNRTLCTPTACVAVSADSVITWREFMHRAADYPQDTPPLPPSR